MKTLIGGCMCGEVRFEIKNEALVSLLCHCKDCQKLSGSAFTSGVVFPKDSIFYEKKNTSSYEYSGGSGAKMTRTFCKTCGTPIATVVAGLGDLCVVALVAFDDASQCPAPSVGVHMNNAKPWVTLADSVTKHQFGMS